MISLIMPYWNRLELLKTSLNRLRDLYGQSGELEVIVADDGSGLERDLFDDYDSIGLTIVSLPKKAEAKNPCLPINEAAKVARYKFLAISNPEIYHLTPVLGEMLLDCITNGQKHYVSAATWSVDKRRWYNHTSCTDACLGRAPVPNKNAGLHFLAMMHTQFFHQVGGFDNAYREGQGYEDNDFLWNLHANGASFSIRDDLVVNHFGTNTAWPDGGANRNKALFYKKWQTHLTNQRKANA